MPVRQRRPVLCATAATVLLGLVVGARATPLPIGANLAPLTDYQNQWPFLDLLRHATPFQARSEVRGAWVYGNPASMTLNAEGWPVSLTRVAAETRIGASTWMNLLTSITYLTGPKPSLPPQYMPGEYVVLWQGNGSFHLEGDVNATFSTFVHGGRASVVIPRSVTGFFLRITATDAGNPVRNLSIVPRAFEFTFRTQPFTPAFLQLVSPFSVLRFSAWQRESMSSVTAPSLQWSTRTTPANWSQATSGGVAYEYMAALVATTNASIWLSMPQRADAVYIARFFDFWLTFMANNPSYAGTLHVEYSANVGLWPGIGGAVHNIATVLAHTLASAPWSAHASAWRARIELVASIGNLEYFSHTLSFFDSVRPDGAGAFDVLDAVALPGRLGGQLKWDDPVFNISSLINASDSALLDLIRQEQLRMDIELNRFAARVRFMNLNATMRRAPLRIHTFDLGFITHAPSYGARWTLAQFKQRNASAPVPANMTEAADLEQRWHNRISMLQRTAFMRDLHMDALHRLEKSGYSLALVTELMRPPMANLQWDSRLNGNTGFIEGWHVGVGAAPRVVGAEVDLPAVLGVTFEDGNAIANGDATAVTQLLSRLRARSPKYDAVLAYAAGERGSFALTSADRPAPPAATCAPSCVWGTCFRGRCVCHADVTGDDCSVLPAPGSARVGAAACGAPDVAINLGGLKDYSTQLVFVDVQKQSREWISQAGWQDYGFMGWSFGTVPPLDAEGYPRFLQPGYAVGTLMMRDLQGHYPAGTYTVLWDGDGVLDATMTDVVAVRVKDAGVMEVDMLPGTSLNNGMFLRVERSNPADPVRNIRVIMPGYVDTYEQFPFYPPFLNLVRNFTTLRYMDMMNANAQTDTAWSTRTTPAWRTYTSNGLPLEALVQLANTVGSNPWFTFPYAADDEYVRNMATYVHSALRPDLNVTLEYANEVWGALMGGGRYAQARGVAGNYSRFSGAGIYDNTDEARFCYYAMRSRDMFRIWADVWTQGGTQPVGRARLTFTISSQAVNADVSRRIMACDNVGAEVDTLAVAPYFSSPVTRNDSRLDSQLVTLHELMNVSLPAVIAGWPRLLREHAAVAARWNATLTTYEAGQHLLGYSFQQQQLAEAANAHPAMGDLYYQYMNMLRAEGVVRISLYSSFGLPSQYGYWGLMPALDSTPDAQPKWLAVMKYINEHRQCVPAHTPGRSGDNSSAVCPAGEYAPGDDVLPCSGRGWCMDFPVPGASGKACACHEGYTGAACNVTTFVDISTCSWRCSGHGTCKVQRIQGNKRYWGCECDAGYGGDRCTAVSCPASCNWHGMCVDANRCACYTGFAGAACDVDCGCGRHGTCAWTRNVTGAASSAITSDATVVSALPPSCACDAGYEFVRDGTIVRAPANASYAYGSAERTDPASRAGVVNSPTRPPVVAAFAGTLYAGGACRPVCLACTANQTCLRPGVCSCEGACVNGDCVSGTCMCWNGFAGKDCSKKQRASIAVRNGTLTAALSPMGVNLGGVAYWGTNVPFIDMMKSSSAWIAQHNEVYRPGSLYVWDLGDTVPRNLSDLDWPTRVEPPYALGKLMVRDVKRRLPDGRYVVRYEGQGVLSFGFDATVVSRSEGRIEIDVRLSEVRDNGIFLQVLEVNPANPVRDIRVLLPGTEEQSDDGFPFYAPFLHALRNYSAIRFMDWAHTNGASHVHWADRPRVGKSSYAGGVPLEVMIHLCNVLGVEPWFNMPTEATPEYITSFARMVRDRLRPDVGIYVERGNEVWNPLFESGRANQAAAVALGVYASQLHAARSVQMIQLWTDVFGPAERARRIVHVLSTQTVNTWITRTMLAYNNTWQYVDALGVTAYIDCGGLGSRNNAQRSALLSVDQVLEQCYRALPGFGATWRAQMLAVERVVNASLATSALPSPSVTPSSMPTPTRTPSVTPWTEVGSQGLNGSSNSSAGSGSENGTALPDLEFTFDPEVYSPRSRIGPVRIPLIVYEGGLGLVEQSVIETNGGVTPGLTELFIAANRHAGMEGVYRAYLDSFLELGLLAGRGRTFPYMQFVDVGAPTKYGSWGLLEYQTQNVWEAPKARAMASFVADVVFNLTRPGCTNPRATNFNPIARVADDSCVFPPVNVSVSGGVVTVPDVPVELAFPPGALNSSVPISVAQVPAANVTVSYSTGADASNSSASYVIASPVFSFGPAGTHFSAPVNVCITVNMTEVAESGWGMTDGNDATAVANSSSLTLHLYHSSNGGLNWTAAENSTFDETTGQLCASMWHFTLAAGMRVDASVAVADVTAAVEERAAALPTPPAVAASSSVVASPSVAAPPSASPVAAVPSSTPPTATVSSVPALSASATPPAGVAPSPSAGLDMTGGGDAAPAAAVSDMQVATIVGAVVGGIVLGAFVVIAVMVVRRKLARRHTVTPKGGVLTTVNAHAASGTRVVVLDAPSTIVNPHRGGAFTATAHPSVEAGPSPSAAHVSQMNAYRPTSMRAQFDQRHVNM